MCLLNYRFYNLILLFVIGLMFNSCNKKEWLEVKAENRFAVPSSLKDLQAMLDNSDQLMNSNSPAMGEMASDGHYMTSNTYQTRGAIEKNAYTWSNLQPYVNVLDWSFSYQRVYYCNLILEASNKISKSEIGSENWRSVKGQALFQRARSYYELSVIFCPPYHYLSVESQLGLPLRLESDINIVSFRATLRETYRQIINDIKEACALLPVKQEYLTRPTRIAALALLSRIYLSIEDYANAGKYADSVLLVQDSLIDYNTLISSQNFPLPRFNVEVIFHSTISNWSSISSSNTLIDTSFYNQYLSADLRRKVLFRVNANQTINYKGSYNNSAVLFSGLSLNETYLIRAECYARSGDLNSAMSYLSKLVKKRWDKSVPFTPFVASSQVDALRVILKEREKELFLRGLRWVDLRRINRDPNYAMDISHPIGLEKYVLKPNDFRYTFPIPQDVLSLSGIQQNIGW